MNRGLVLISWVLFVFIAIVPCLVVVLASAQHHQKSQANIVNNNNKAVKSELSKTNLPLVVEDTSAGFKTTASTSELTKLDNKNDYIYLNTIDGLLYAVSKQDGKVKWTLEEEAVLKFPENYDQ